MSPLDWIDDELAVLEKEGLRRHLAQRDGPQSGESIRLDGRTLINFGSNDYLGLAAELLSAKPNETTPLGWGSGASPLVTGRGSLHAELERTLAEFEGTQAALFFPSGFAANMGTIAALVGKPDVIFSDAKNHASIIDGCRLSGAKIHAYPHNDIDSLRAVLESAGSYRRRMIVTDSLFSMDGDLARLPELAELADQFDAMLMVDEAHATGIFGASGRGVCEHQGVEDGVHIRVGTLSKALGSIGGFVAGTQSLIDWLANRARPYVFSTAPPEAIASAALEAIRIVREQPERRANLLTTAADLRESLRSRGWNYGKSESQIVPIFLGDLQRTMQMSAQLKEEGIFVPGIRPPTVPQGESLLRISLTCDHSAEAIDRLLASLQTLQKF